jgi:hypothetical protein
LPDLGDFLIQRLSAPFQFNQAAPQGCFLFGRRGLLILAESPLERQNLGALNVRPDDPRLKGADSFVST